MGSSASIPILLHCLVPIQKFARRLCVSSAVARVLRRGLELPRDISTLVLKRPPSRVREQQVYPPPPTPQSYGCRFGCTGVWRTTLLRSLPTTRVSDNERLIGDTVAMNPTNTQVVSDARRLIGRKFEDSEQGGKPYIRVEYRGEQLLLSPSPPTSTTTRSVKLQRTPAPHQQMQLHTRVRIHQHHQRPHAHNPEKNAVRHAVRGILAASAVPIAIGCMQAAPPLPSLPVVGLRLQLAINEAAIVETLPYKENFRKPEAKVIQKPSYGKIGRWRHFQHRDGCWGGSTGLCIQRKAFNAQTEHLLIHGYGILKGSLKGDLRTVCRSDCSRWNVWLLRSQEEGKAVGLILDTRRPIDRQLRQQSRHW
ncbi:hypothetical protein DFH06DRAFT_1121100 [Mycena polygramma]|nr:hypothetical protein DFH06DRAFT_1121100 [Mycena polygramma]